MNKIIKEILCSIAFILMVIMFIPFCLVIRAHASELSPYREIIMNATDEEMREFEQVLYLEAHIDTWEGRVATAQVVLNRVLDPRFKNSIHDVLSTVGPVQYPTYWQRDTALPGEAEADAIAFLCNCEKWELVIDQRRIYQDMNPIGKNPIKVGKQYFGY